MRRTRDDDIGLYTVGVERAYRVLRGFRFHFPQSSRYRKVRDHHEEHIARVQEVHDARGVDIERVLEIPYRAPDLHYRNIGARYIRRTLQALDNLVSHVRDRFDALS